MKTIVNTLVILVISVCTTYGQFSHDREVGIRFNNINDYDLLFKKKISDNSYRRIRIANLNMSLRDGENQDLRFGLGANIALGIEKRKALTEEFNFIYGLEGILGANYSRFRDDNSGSYNAGVGFVIGWNYQLNENITLGVETIPSIMYTTNLGDITRTHNINAGFSTGAASLTATYGF